MKKKFYKDKKIYGKNNQIIFQDKIKIKTLKHP